MYRGRRSGAADSKTYITDRYIIDNAQSPD